MERNILHIKCNNASCGQTFGMQHPGKEGIYGVECPYCKQSLKVRVAAAAPPSSQEVKSDEDYSNDAPQKIEGSFLVGQRYEVECPHCHKAKIGYTPSEAGLKGVPCPLCHGVLAIEAHMPTVNLASMKSIVLVSGKLVTKKWGFSKSYRLKIGSNTVGRKDSSMPSDISLDDNTISRRSIDIEVRQTTGGYVFKLKVLKATNPVVVNNTQYTEGEVVSLNFGDRLLLGKTKFTFVKDA